MIHDFSLKERLFACGVCSYNGIEVVEIDRQKYCPVCYAMGIETPVKIEKPKVNLQKRAFGLTDEQYDWLCSMGVASKVLRKIFDEYMNRKYITKVIDLENGDLFEKSPVKKEIVNRMLTVKPEHIQWLKKFNDPNELVRTIIDHAKTEAWRYQK